MAKTIDGVGTSPQERATVYFSDLNEHVFACSFEFTPQLSTDTSISLTVQDSFVVLK